jgi:hypothetical protein
MFRFFIIFVYFNTVCYSAYYFRKHKFTQLTDIKIFLTLCVFILVKMKALLAFEKSRTVTEWCSIIFWNIVLCKPQNLRVILSSDTSGTLQYIQIPIICFSVAWELMKHRDDVSVLYYRTSETNVHSYYTENIYSIFFTWCCVPYVHFC